MLLFPPLRYRGDDILLLANNFAVRMATELGREDIPIFSEEVERKLLSYNWPGNVRELKNVVERAVYRTKGSIVENIETDPFHNPYLPIGQNNNEDTEDPYTSLSLDSLEKAHEDLDVSFLSRALRLTEGNQKKAAEEMGISYDSFRGMYRKYRDRLKDISK